MIERRKAAGDGSREALRILKRRRSDVVYPNTPASSVHPGRVYGA
jgi:hypothetical protein